MQLKDWLTVSSQTMHKVPRHRDVTVGTLPEGSPLASPGPISTAVSQHAFSLIDGFSKHTNTRPATFHKCSQGSFFYVCSGCSDPSITQAGRLVTHRQVTEEENRLRKLELQV